MRMLFIAENELDDIWAKDEKTAFEPISKELRRRFAPWAAEIHAVDGGWMAWESVEDYRTWTGQR